MTARRVALLLASLGWLWSAACAREVALPDGPVAWVAWLKGQVEVAGVDGQVRPAAVDMDLLLADSLRLADGAAAVLGLHNDHLVLIETSVPVRAIPALRSPPDGRPAAAKLASLLDASGLSERDRLEARNARIAGWHVRRNAASTVTAQQATPERRQVTVEETAAEAPTPTERAADKDEETRPASRKGSPAPATPTVEAEPPGPTGRGDEAIAKVQQAQRNEEATPTPPAKPKPAPAVAAPLQPSPAASGALEPAPGSVATRASDDATDAEVRRDQRPGKREAGRVLKPRRERKAPPVVEVLGVEGRLDVEFQEQLTALLGDAKIREVIKARAPRDASSQEVVLRIEEGILLDLRLAAGREITSKVLEEWQRRHRGASTDTATVRARVRLDP